jgi:hypothetical protein
MIPRKLSCLFVFFAYAGNSTGTSEVADLREWFSRLLLKLKTDPKFKDRVENVAQMTLADTPITMTRNRAVKICRKLGYDILVMVDSDMRPDVHLGQDPLATPFFETAFDAIYKHYDKGPLVIAAPYGGCPPYENMFVFTWTQHGNLGDESPIELRQYTREEASVLAGIQEAAALPTGLIAYDIRAFDLIEKPYFSYEWTDEDQSDKGSTEDVVNTRDIGIAGVQKLGYNPCLCAWSSWAGHMKTWCVGKPMPYTTSNVSDALTKAIKRGISERERVVDLGFQNQSILEGKEIHRHPSCDEDNQDRLEEVELTPENGFGHKTPKAHLETLAKIITTLGISKRNLKVVEVGSWLGDSAKAMVDTGVCRVLCVDHWRGNKGDHTGINAKVINDSDTPLYKRFCQNVGHRLGDTIEVYRGCSLDAAKDLKKPTHHILKKFMNPDMVFIDAEHTYEAVKADILAWLPLVASDGIMIGHDYKTGMFPGLDQVVEEIFGNKVLPVGMTKQGGFWMVHMGEINREAILKKYAKKTTRKPKKKPVKKTTKKRTSARS